MNEHVTVEVTTQVFGLGGGRTGAPTLIELSERTVSARDLIAEHVRAEVRRTQERREMSLALHYMLADDVRSEPLRSAITNLSADTEVKRAWRGLADRRYVLIVDGVSVDDLDTQLAITERSHISFVRLLPLVGG